MKSHPGKFTQIGVLVLIFGSIGIQSTWARWAPGTEMPVSRLLKNGRAYVKAHPKDPRGYVTLGRINSAAFAWDAAKISVLPNGRLPIVITNASMKFPSRDRAKPLSPRALTYLSDAIANYKKATDLNASDGIGWFGLGFECEEALRFPQAIVRALAAMNLPGKADAESLRQEAMRSYRKAFTLTVKAEMSHPNWMGNPMSMEAAQEIVRLQEHHPLSPVEATELEEMKKQIAVFKSHPRPISPILISFQRDAALKDLLAPEKHSHFDLAGDNLGRQWPWIKPTTGILVWDPKHTGKITSGLQLFGNVTWWLFWKDGYEPLAALDNNRNSWLEGAELQGIAVWFDRNSNGISDRGEVVSLTSLGIKRIAACSAGQADGVPANPNGIQLRDGSSLPTFDWTPTSLPASLTRSGESRVN